MHGVCIQDRRYVLLWDIVDKIGKALEKVPSCRWALDFKVGEWRHEVVGKECYECCRGRSARKVSCKRVIKGSAEVFLGIKCGVKEIAEFKFGGEGSLEVSGSGEFEFDECDNCWKGSGSIKLSLGLGLVATVEVEFWRAECEGGGGGWINIVQEYKLYCDCQRCCYEAGEKGKYSISAYAQCKLGRWRYRYEIEKEGDLFEIPFRKGCWTTGVGGPPELVTLFGCKALFGTYH